MDLRDVQSARASAGRDIHAGVYIGEDAVYYARAFAGAEALLDSVGVCVDDAAPLDALDAEGRERSVGCEEGLGF